MKVSNKKQACQLNNWIVNPPIKGAIAGETWDAIVKSENA